MTPDDPIGSPESTWPSELGYPAMPGFEAAHGLEIQGLAFGASLMHTETHGHGGYRDVTGGNPSVSLQGQAAVVAGAYGQVDVDPGGQTVTRPRLVLLLAAVLVLGGCSQNSSPHQSTAGSTPAMQAMKRADADAQVKKPAADIADLVGAPLRRWRTQPAPCVNGAGGDASDGSWDLSGSGNVDLAAAKLTVTLHQVEQMWRRQDYEQVAATFQPPNGHDASVSATIPGSGVSISVTNTTDNAALAIIVASPCYLPAPGEHPANS